MLCIFSHASARVRLLDLIQTPHTASDTHLFSFWKVSVSTVPCRCCFIMCLCCEAEHQSASLFRHANISVSLDSCLGSFSSLFQSVSLITGRLGRSDQPFSCVNLNSPLNDRFKEACGFNYAHPSPSN